MHEKDKGTNQKAKKEKRDKTGNKEGENAYKNEIKKITKNTRNKEKETREELKGI